MKFCPTEIDRNAPLTLFEKVCGALAVVSPFLGIALVSVLFLAGCKTDPAEVDLDEDVRDAESTSVPFPEVDRWWK